MVVVTVLMEEEEEEEEEEGAKSKMRKKEMMSSRWIRRCWIRRRRTNVRELLHSDVTMVVEKKMPVTMARNIVREIQTRDNRGLL